jgi:hypothetical protein
LVVERLRVTASILTLTTELLSYPKYYRGL